MTSRSELKRAYKEVRPPMGVFVIRNVRNGRFLLHATTNLKGGMNRLRVEITPSTNPNVALKTDWDTMGAAAFDVRVLDELEPKDAPGWDASADLAELKALWHARLVAEGGTSY
jgi:hypothetical protein